MGVEHVSGVRSRVSWQAILAGGMTALALSFLLALLGGAIGLSIRDAADGRTIGIGAAVYAVLATALALFAGGVVASQLTAGENKREAALYGGFVWAVVMAAFMFLAAGGVKAGFGAMVGGGDGPQRGGRHRRPEHDRGGRGPMLRRANYCPEQIKEMPVLGAGRPDRRLRPPLTGGRGCQGW